MGPFLPCQGYEYILVAVDYVSKWVKLFGHGKLRSKWEGPYLVIDAMTHGALTLQDNDGNVFKVNGHRLKLFYEHEPLEKEVDMIEFVLNPIN